MLVNWKVFFLQCWQWMFNCGILQYFSISRFLFTIGLESVFNSINCDTTFATWRDHCIPFFYNIKRWNVLILFYFFLDHNFFHVVLRYDVSCFFFCICLFLFTKSHLNLCIKKLEQLNFFFIYYCKTQLYVQFFFVRLVNLNFLYCLQSKFKTFIIQLNFIKFS